MKNIFLCEDKSSIDLVYSPEIRKKISCYDCFCHKDLTKNTGLFRDTQYIFSTWGMPELTSEEIKNIFPALKAVFYAAGTVQYFARPFLENGIKVFSAWAANAVPVAEYTAAQILLAGKSFFSLCTKQSAGRLSDAEAVKKRIIGNYKTKVGIIGAGMIGKRVIELLRPFKLEILVFDPFLPPETAKKLGVKTASLETLFSECRIVSNHLANNADTRGIINYRLFSLMKEDGVFINTGRGAQAVEDDLVRILRERPDITAVLDVTNPEPPEKNHPFYSLENCLLTPHIAGSLGNEVLRMAEYMREEYESLLQKGSTRYEVTLKMLETMA